jgi:hypothetical protein
MPFLKSSRIKAKIYIDDFVLENCLCVTGDKERKIQKY